ncbi:MAG TPA: nucleotide sugar dehydrogenase [Candidatus Coprenecus pullistercoris]|nr:nucleotide sugar dehydrogenase [Candidatus Coprenecus pullistercoris]
MKEQLLKKISDKSISAGVVGLGYVGLPLAVEIAKAGFFTTGFDLIEDKVNKVNKGENYISDVDHETLRILTAEGRLRATTDFSRIADMDFIAICVPTPLDTHQQPDLSYIEHSSMQIAQFLKKGTMVVLESTTFPGTTSDIVRPILEKGSGLICGKDFYLAFSPERVDPGNAHYKTGNTPKVVGAIGQDAEDVIKAMYESFLEGGVYPVSSPAIAEMEKILENTYRNINIGLINEMAMLCDRMKINIWEVIDAAKTKPYGFQAFYPGPGLGGHCIPLDPYYLSWKVREYAFHTSMIEASMMINDRMPEYCAQRVTNILNEFSKSLKGSRILVLGVAYKADIDDCRESPAIRVINVLRKKGADVTYFDPYVKEYSDHGIKYSGESELTPSLLEKSDIVIITTAHSNVDYGMVQKHSRYIFDTRNAMHGIKDRDNIELL